MALDGHAQIPPPRRWPWSSALDTRAQAAVDDTLKRLIVGGRIDAQVLSLYRMPAAQAATLAPARANELEDERG